MGRLPVRSRALALRLSGRAQVISVCKLEAYGCYIESWSRYAESQARKERIAKLAQAVKAEEEKECMFAGYRLLLITYMPYIEGIGMVLDH